jgi:lysophospholipase L1-like esterase
MTERRLPSLILAPVLAAQALGLILRAERLPEAVGPREGSVGQGIRLRLLVLGDSSAAGVGVGHQDEALIGQMLRHMTPYSQVDWRLVARSGVTTRVARSRLNRAGQFDVAVLALGVNDVLRHTSALRFAREQTGLMQDLRRNHGVGCILASAVPPLGAFPAFPEPLRTHLGHRAARLDRVLQQVCASENATHVGFDLPPSRALLARDGFHPSADLYAHWGARMAGLALRALS